MNVQCTICSDGIIASSETYTTSCGHLFHYICLIQWLERSKTCPQCRNRVTEKAIHRIYFNLVNVDGQGDDPATLQFKYDNLQFQLTLKEKDVKNLTEKYNKAKSHKIALRERIIELENNVRSHDSVVFALKDQITYFKNKAKEKDKLNEEVLRLKEKLKQMQSIELAINGSREEMNEMLKTESDVESLVILVTTLKKALLDAETKKTNVEYRCKQLQNDLAACKRDISNLELSNQQLKHELELVRAVRAKKGTLPRKSNDTPETQVSNKRKIEIEVEESPKKQETSVSSDTSLTANSSIISVPDSDSPYLRLKKSSFDLHCHKGSTTSLPKSIAPKPVSIFKSTTLKPHSLKPYETENPRYKVLLSGSSKADSVSFKRHKSISNLSLKTKPT